MKKFVRPLVAGAGIAGGLAAANRALRDAPLPVNALGGQRLPWNWRGHDIFATEAGTGPPVLLVHGVHAGASSYEYRALFPLLAARHRVVAFDLLGCGLSDKPNVAYSADLFIEQILAALDAFGDGPVALVGSRLGAAFAIGAATRAERRVGRLAAICPTGFTSRFDREAKLRGAALAGAIRVPLVGEALYNALAAKRSLRWFLANRIYADPARANADVVDHYYAVTHQPGSRHVAAAAAGGLLNCDLARDLPFLTVPLAVLWGEQASAFAPLAAAEDVLRLAPHAQLTTFTASGVLPHEEEPAAVDAVLERFLTLQTV